MNTLVKMQEALEKKNIIWRRHVLSRMLERNISRDDVFNTIQYGKIIESYPEDKPYPSYLISGFSGDKRIHVVASWDDGAQAVYIITAYIPDEDHFQDNGITRKAR
ncbi:DUF4258 domain-containing protein [Desulfonatronovibrio magnus]|uniref:DUF4258 domain-containing protein n=1 Tax=Desulfonatronovibrio magnus TaxID=698827 RepID=UPI0018DDEE02|nr:DUF4258 domain-containing protein [Desulfonatronovibrio magnus]